MLEDTILDARRKFWAQKKGAKQRGIEFLFTFQEWLDWWGEDWPKRGVGHDKLQCQRIADKGPYAPWNCRKGYPKDNGITAGKNKRTFNTLRAKEALDLARGQSEPVEKDNPEELYSEDERYLHGALGHRQMSKASFL